MDAAYVFGNLGNLTDCLGAGWSVEDAFAWTVGTDESTLTLPLPGDDLPYVVRFDVHPAVFPPEVISQRLTVLAGATVLATLEMKRRRTVSVALPSAVTRGRRQVVLTLLHPDAARPVDHARDDDTRLLGFCFHSASLARDGTAPRGRRSPARASAVVDGLIAGGPVARLLCQVISRLACLKGRFIIHFVDLSQPLDHAIAGLPAGAIAAARFCWTEINGGAAAKLDLLAGMLPRHCGRRSFHGPACGALWPFCSRNADAAAEPDRTAGSGYPYGDRFAQALAGVGMTSDMLLLMYDAATDREPVDLDAMLAEDQGLWQRQDKESGMQLADFIAGRFRQDRLFVAPDRVGPTLLREMVRQILDDPLVNDVASASQIARDLDAVLDGYTGPREQVPVHPRVAAHFGLAWWSPDMQYRWMNNLLSQRDHVLNVIKSAPWRP